LLQFANACYPTFILSMFGRMFILCACMLPTAGSAVRDGDRVGSSEDFSEDKSSMFCLMGDCKQCVTCATCASDACAWTSDEEIYDLVSNNTSLDDFEKLEKRIQNFNSATSAERLLTGTCIENPKRAEDTGDKSNRYIVATKYIPWHEIYNLEDPHWERSDPKVVLTGSDATQACQKLGVAFEKETTNAKKQIQEKGPIFRAKRQELEQKRELERLRLEQEMESKRLRDERKKTDKLTVSDILEICADQASETPKRKVPKEFFVSSRSLAASAMFKGEMQRYGAPTENHKDWDEVLTLRKKVTDGNFYHPVKVGFMKEHGKVFLVIYDGRHRVCAMEGQSVITEVTVNCGSVTSEDASKLSNKATENLINAPTDCRRSKSLYDDWVTKKAKEEKDAEEARRKAEREKREREMNQPGKSGNAGTGYVGYSHY